VARVSSQVREPNRKKRQIPVKVAIAARVSNRLEKPLWKGLDENIVVKVVAESQQLIRKTIVEIVR
jgi:hypothetical protein